MSTSTFNIHEAKTHLSRLIERAEAGETIIIAKAGKPKVQLSLIPTHTSPQPGRFAGQIHYHEEFDTPLPAEELAAWEGQIP